MSEINFSYLGCYKRKNNNPVVANNASIITNNQLHCYKEAKNNKFFAMQIDRCFIGNELESEKVDDENCNQICGTNVASDGSYDVLYSRIPANLNGGKPGCGSSVYGNDKFFSVYQVFRSLQPQSTKLHPNELYISGSPIGETFKDGLYKFNCSNYSFNNNPRKAFDQNKYSNWTTPYMGQPYDYERSKNYLENPYKSISDGNNNFSYFEAVYNQSNKKRSMFGTSPVHETTEKKLGTDHIPNTHYGEWIEVEFPFSIRLNSFSLAMAQIKDGNSTEKLSNFRAFARAYVLLGSNGDGWKLLGAYNNHSQGLKIINSVNLQGRLGPEITPEFDRLSLVPFENTVLKSEPYNKYRIVVKSTYGNVMAKISSIDFSGTVCIAADGYCDPSHSTSAVNLLSNLENSNSVQQNIVNFEGFQNKIVEDSFISTKINNLTCDPLNENCIFDDKYSKY